MRTGSLFMFYKTTQQDARYIVQIICLTAETSQTWAGNGESFFRVNI